MAEEYSMMAEIGQIISSSLDINDVYSSLVERIRRLIPYDPLTMSLVDNANQTTSSTWLVGASIPGRGV